MLLGTLLAGRYKIIRPLGEGGFGEAYLAEDQHLPDAQCCVVKKLKTDHHEAATLKIARRLFDAEAKMLHRLGHHDQIPRLLAHFEEEGFYLVEEFVEGHSIDQELVPGQPLEEGDAIALLHGILEVLDFVHQNQVIHRDIKPSNLIRRQTDGKIVLIDFGAVKQMTTQLTNNHSRTPQTVLIGSPGYVPSEQFRGNPKLSSDVYAVGMIGIQALTGINPGIRQLPEDEETGELVWRNCAKVSPDFATLIEKMVLYDYRQRYGSASSTLAALQVLIDAREASGPPQADIGLAYNLAQTDVSVVDQVPVTLVTALPQEQGTVQTGTETTAISPRSEVTEPTADVTEPTAIEPGQEAAPLPETAAQDSTQYQEDIDNSKDSPVQSAVAVTTTVATSAPLPDAESLSQEHLLEVTTTVAAPAPLPAIPRTAKNAKKLKAAALGIMVLLLGGSTLGLVSPHVEPLCQVLNNCSRNLRFQAVHKDAIANAEAAQADSEQAKSLKDLEAAHNRLEDALAALKSIPEDVEVYPTVRKELPEYQKQFEALQTRLVAEKKAQETFQQAEATATAAKKKMAEVEKSTTVAPLSDVQKQWQTSQTQLKSVPKDSFVAAQAKEKQQSQEKEIQALQSKINQLIAAEQERQAAAAAAAHRQQAAAAQRSAAVRSTASSSSTAARASTTSRSTPSTPSRSTPSTPSRSTSSPAARSPTPSAPKAAPKEPLWDEPAIKEPLW